MFRSDDFANITTVTTARGPNRTVSAACLYYVIVRNGTGQTHIARRHSQARTEAVKKNAQLSTSRIGSLPVDPYYYCDAIRCR